MEKFKTYSFILLISTCVYFLLALNNYWFTLIPLWIMAGTGIYLFFSQSGERRNNKFPGYVAGKMLNNLKKAVILFNSQSSIVFANTAARKLFGVPSGMSGRGEELKTFIGRRNFTKLEEIIKALSRKEKRIQSEKVLTKKNGKAFYSRINFSVFKNRGELINQLCIDNISEEKLLVKILKEEIKKLQEMNDELMDLDMRKSEFLNYVAHEFKTPLTSIRMGSSLLMRHQRLSKEKKEEFIIMLRKECVRLEKMIDNVLDLVRIESKKLQINRTLCDLEGIVRRAADLYEEKLNRKNMRVIPWIDDELKNIFIDRERVTRIFGNIIDNSIKNGDHHSEIIINARKSGSVARIEIKNTGKLIPDDTKEIVFEKYYKSVESRGAGIGLYVIKEIVEQHGGMIRVEDNIDDETGNPCGVVFKIDIQTEDMEQNRVVNA